MLDHASVRCVDNNSIVQVYFGHHIIVCCTCGKWCSSLP